MEKYQVYRATSVNWRPSPVVALATSPDGAQVAALREDSSLELWLVCPGSVGWHCQLTIQGNRGSRVTSLAWCKNNVTSSDFGRVLSSSVDGSVSEWDLFSLKQKILLDSIGVSIWQMAVEPPSEVVHCSKEHSKLSMNGYANGNTRSSSESCQSDDDDNDYDEINSVHNEKENQRVAFACDDGCIRLYMISDLDGLSYKCSLPRVSGRILSIAWSLDAKLLFSGSSDGLIRCWNCTTGIENYRITVGFGGMSRKSELCVWSILFLRCGTMVSADSSGSVQFWDSRYGTLLQSHSYHKGDANALAASPCHKKVFSAGSDGQVILYNMSKDKNVSNMDEADLDAITKWAYVGYVRAHTHDVRALAVAVPICKDVLLPDEKPVRRRRREKPIEYSYHKWAHLGVPMLLSAGDDTKIYAYSAADFTKFSPHDICPAPQRVLVQLAVNSVIDGDPVIIAQSPAYLDVLSIQTNAFGTSSGGQAATPLLARIRSKAARKIISSAISSSGALLAYSDHVKPCLFELRREKAHKSRLIVSKRKLPRGLPCAHTMVFSVDSSHIMVAGQDRRIYVVNVAKVELQHVFVPRRNECTSTSSPSEPPITKMFVSSDGQWLAAINCFGDIYIFNLEIYRQHWFISRLDGASVTAGGFPPKNCNILVITTSSNQVYVLDVEAKKLGDWSRHHTNMLPRKFLEFPGEVVGLSFPPSSSTSVIVYSSRAMCFIDFGMPFDQDDNDLPNGIGASLEKLYAASKNVRTKQKRKRPEHDLMISKSKNFDFFGFRDPVLFISHFSEKSLFVLQKPWLEIVRTFDAPVHRHVYGT